ncbi:MAG: sigma factor-like helix-turn-helix DNA-binding protein [Erysipelotrichaceae bacterium]
MNKLTHYSDLLDFYGKLLTDHQLNILQLYYNEDFSLQEISEELNISRSAVLDVIKRTNNLLDNYENKLKLLEKFNQRVKVYEDLNIFQENEKYVKILYEIEGE